jgi:hypothetical protein
MKIESFTIENIWLHNMDHGWGNGYVIIPPGHPAHGKHYDEIDVDVHGGLTLSGPAIDWEYIPEGTPEDHWIFGFDTAHYGDSLENWSEEAVKAETQRLVEQFEKMVE